MASVRGRARAATQPIICISSSGGPDGGSNHEIHTRILPDESHTVYAQSAREILGTAPAWVLLIMVPQE